MKTQSFIISFFVALLLTPPVLAQTEHETPRDLPELLVGKVVWVRFDDDKRSILRAPIVGVSEGAGDIGGVTLYFTTMFYPSNGEPISKVTRIYYSTDRKEGQRTILPGWVARVEGPSDRVRLFNVVGRLILHTPTAVYH